MCVASTSKRRRKQAVNGYRHLSPMKRSRYKKSDNSTASKRLERIISRERERQQRAKK